MKKLKEDGLNSAQNYSSGCRGRNRGDRSCWSPERKELCRIAGEIQRRGLWKTLEVEMQFSGREKAKLHSVCSQRSYIKSKFPCVLLHLYTPAFMASFVNAPVQHQCVVSWCWNKPSVPGPCSATHLKSMWAIIAGGFFVPVPHILS